MAVAPTGNIFKALSFDNVSSRTYGVYITGEAVYNAPGRDVEMVEIPGRNGSFALDKGRFQNIEVSYPAGIFADNEANFAEAISDFRNCLCSRKGYCRLTDEYNPDEYRMAIYKSGLEVTPAQRVAGEFNIVFDCKPQRYLMSGEVAIDITSGDTLLNPTMFDASPLLAVEGYGEIDINSATVEIANTTLGDILINNGEEWKARSVPAVRTIQPGLELLNNGDLFSIGKVYAEYDLLYKIYGADSATFYAGTGPITGTLVNSSGGITIRVELDPIDLVKGTSVSDIVGNKPCNITAHGGGSSISATPIFGLTVQYSGGDTITIRARLQDAGGFKLRNVKFGYSTILGGSTKSALGNPTYIDLDAGEVYGNISGITVDLNNAALLPTELPKLSPGANTIEYDNTITELKLTPRWHKI